MQKIEVRDLDPKYNFGAEVIGIDNSSVHDEKIRQEVRDLFEDRGLLIFRGVEGPEMQIELSKIFGPLKDHPVPSVRRSAENPQMIDMRYDPVVGGLQEIEGQVIAHWLPWHFDHCYNDKLNRGGVLRPIVISPEGGFTGFLDGIEAYERLSKGLKARIEGHKALYILELSLSKMRFGLPPGFREVRVNADSMNVMRDSASFPRAIHPMVFERSDGRKVLHVSPWMAVGIQGQEDEKGDELLETVVQEMLANATPYFHAWRPDDMAIWDNCRMLHSVSGCHPDFERRMQRTTIVGDYGLGSFENGAQGRAELEMTV
jgi:taurine dioxygenase